MPAFIDLTGRTFGRWTVIERAISVEKRAVWKCVCQCGNIGYVRSRIINSGQSKSCGCFSLDSKRERTITHGLHGTAEYKIWSSIVQRCTNRKNKAYEDYGGRGIFVSDSWKLFENFINDMGLRPSKELSVERVDNDGGYCKENCKWATRTEQQHNRRMNKTNKLGVTGVSYLPLQRKYKARIYAGKMIDLGVFETIEEATFRRKEAEIKYWGKSS